MKKESSTASILALFLVAPFIGIILIFNQVGEISLILWSIALIGTSILQGRMSASRKEGREVITWGFLWFFAQLAFQAFVFVGGCFLLLSQGGYY